MFLKCINKECRKFGAHHIASNNFKRWFHKNCDYERCTCEKCPELKIPKTQA